MITYTNEYALPLSFNENNLDDEESYALRTLINFELLDSNDQPVSIESVQSCASGPVKARGFAIEPYDKDFRDMLFKLASPVHHSVTASDNYLAKHAPVTRTTPLVSNAQLQNIGIGESAPLPMSTGNDGKDTVDNDLKAKRNPNVDIDWESAKEGDSIDAYDTQLYEWRGAKIVEVTEKQVKYHFENGWNEGCDQWVNKGSKTLCLRGKSQLRDELEMSAIAQMVAWYQPKSLFARVKKNLGIDPRNGRGRGIQAVEIQNIVDYCIDYTYCNPSLWLIARSGIWYRVAGLLCPGGQHGTPKDSYKDTFRVTSTKFSACCHMAMVIYDFYSINPKMPLQEIVNECQNRSHYEITEHYILANHEYIYEQVCALPRPSDWNKRIRPISESIFATQLKKFGSGAEEALEIQKKRKAAALKKLENIKSKKQASEANRTIQPSQDNQVKTEGEGEKKEGEGEKKEGEEEKKEGEGEKKEGENTEEKEDDDDDGIIEIKQPPVVLAEVRYPIMDSFHWELQLRNGNISSMPPKSGEHLSHPLIAPERYENIVSIWTFLLNFHNLLEIPPITLQDLIIFLAKSEEEAFLRDLHVKMLSHWLTEKGYNKSSFGLSFLESLPMILKSASFQVAYDKSKGGESQEVVADSLRRGDLWLEIIRVILATQIEHGGALIDNYFSPIDEMLGLVEKTMNLENAQPFCIPVDPIRDAAPAYFEHILEPMDLGLIKDRIQSGWYDDQLIRDKNGVLIYASTADDELLASKSGRSASMNVEKGKEDSTTRYKGVEGILTDVRLIWQNCYKYFNMMGPPAPSNDAATSATNENDPMDEEVKEADGEDAGDTEKGEDGEGEEAQEVGEHMIVTICKEIEAFFEAQYQIIMNPSAEMIGSYGNNVVRNSDMEVVPDSDKKDSSATASAKASKKSKISKESSSSSNSATAPDTPVDGNKVGKDLTYNVEGLMYMEHQEISVRTLLMNITNAATYRHLTVEMKIDLLLWLIPEFLQLNGTRKHIVVVDLEEEERLKREAKARARQIKLEKQQAKEAEAAKIKAIQEADAARLASANAAADVKTESGSEIGIKQQESAAAPSEGAPPPPAAAAAEAKKEGGEMDVVKSEDVAPSNAPALPTNMSTNIGADGSASLSEDKNVNANSNNPPSTSGATIPSIPSSDALATVKDEEKPTDANMEVQETVMEAPVVVKPKVSDVRLFPLGRGDRFGRRYWAFEAITGYYDKDDLEKISRPALYVEDVTTGQWTEYSAPEDLKAMVKWLDTRGKLEASTRIDLMNWMKAVKAIPTDCLYDAEGFEKMNCEITYPEGTTFSVDRPYESDTDKYAAFAYKSELTATTHLCSLSLDGPLGISVQEKNMPKNKEMLYWKQMQVVSYNYDAQGNSNGKNADLQIGDRLLACDGTVVEDVGTLQSIIAKAKAAKQAQLQVLLQRPTLQNALIYSAVEASDMDVEGHEASLNRLRVLSHQYEKTTGIVVGLLLWYYDRRIETKDKDFMTLANTYIKQISDCFDAYSVKPHDEQVLKDLVQTLRDCLLHLDNKVYTSTGEDALPSSNKYLKQIWLSKKNRIRYRWLHMLGNATTLSQVSICAEILGRSCQHFLWGGAAPPPPPAPVATLLSTPSESEGGDNTVS